MSRLNPPNARTRLAPHFGRRCGLLGLVALSCSDPTVDPPTNGSIALFYDVNIDDADPGLEDLVRIEIHSLRLTANWHDGATSDEIVLDPDPGTQLLPAETKLVFGPTFEAPPGEVTQLRIWPSEVTLVFGDGHTEPVRVPSADQSGWKVVVDEATYPDGYPVTSREVTGILLDLDVGELLHHNGPQGWMSRPTISSTLYDITDNLGYEPDKLVVVFDPATPDATIDAIFANQGFTVDFAYPHAPPKLYKVDLPPNLDLEQAHGYLRGFPEVLAAAPSANLRQRLVPPDGTPPELDVLGAETGWDAGTGATETILAELTFGMDTEHPQLRDHLWINAGEILPLCANCDTDGDGIVTVADFNDPAYAGPAVPDIGDPGVITCRDLLDAGSPFMNATCGAAANEPCDDDGNGFANDLCGWNFGTNSPDVTSTGGSADYDHDTACAGIMGARGDDGGAVGVCWGCRLMVVIPKLTDPFDDRITVATAETMAAFAYAQANGAHAANFSAGIDLTRDSDDLCPNRAYQVKDEAWDTVVDELDALVTTVFSAAADTTPGTTLFVLAGGECSPGIDDGLYAYYDWPGEAYASATTSARQALVVAASANTATDDGPLASYSNFGVPFELTAPGSWAMMLDGSDGNTYSAPGTSFAAPTVAGIAGLVVSGDPATFQPQTAGALKAALLTTHSVVDPDVAAIPGSRIATMTGL